MHIQEEVQPRTAGDGLWRRAPVWRWSLIGAAVCTGLLIFAQQMPEAEKSTATPQAAQAPQKAAVAPSTAMSPPSISATKPIQNAANVPPTNVSLTPAVQNQEPKKKYVPAISPISHTKANKDQVPQNTPRKPTPTTDSHSIVQEHPASEPKSQAVARTEEANQSAEQPQANSCGSQIPRSFPPIQHHVFKVLGFLPRQEALALIAVTQKEVGMLISPRFVDNQRVMLVPVSGQAERYTVALVPQGMQVKVGDVVDFTTGFKLDSQYPCNYIPNLVDRVVATAAPRLPDSALQDRSSNQ